MVDNIKNTYIVCAAKLGLGDLTRLGTNDPKRGKIITQCADGYVKATKDGNEELRSAYISALMLLFWGEAKKMADVCKAVTELEYEDFVSKLYECIEIACKYNKWAEGTHSAEACIRSTISSRGAAAILYETNLDKNRSNINSYSLDNVISDKDGHQTAAIDLVEDATADPAKTVERPADRLVQNLLDDNKITEAIILENVASSMCERYIKTTSKQVDTDTNEEVKVVKTSVEFWAYRLIKNLKEMPTDYFNYFRGRFKVKDDVLINALADLSKTTSTKLYKMWDKTKALVQTEDIRALLSGN